MFRGSTIFVLLCIFSSMSSIVSAQVFMNQDPIDQGFPEMPPGFPHPPEEFDDLGGLMVPAGFPQPPEEFGGMDGDIIVTPKWPPDDPNFPPNDGPPPPADHDMHVPVSEISSVLNMFGPVWVFFLVFALAPILVCCCVVVGIMCICGCCVWGGVKVGHEVAEAQKNRGSSYPGQIVDGQSKNPSRV